eukprot:706415-Hanusia_phi.AAC.2
MRKGDGGVAGGEGLTAALTIQRVTRGHGGRNAARAMMKELLEGAVAREEEEEEEMREDFDNLRSQSRASVSVRRRREEGGGGSN